MTALNRFVEAQDHAYRNALGEIRRGAKRSHWMWYIFPQFTGLGQSPTARFFAIRSMDEARAYLDHPILGPRYVECVEAMQHMMTSDPVAVFGAVDAMKLRSSLTLFEAARPRAIFTAALDRWFDGERDKLTISHLQMHAED